MLLFGPAAAPGTDGAMSWFGTLVAIPAAAVVAVIGCYDAPRTGLAVLLAGFAGNLVDSVLGATVQRALGRHANDAVNLLATGSGAALAAQLGYLFG
jgi:uncharacterized membrane protein